MRRDSEKEVETETTRRTTLEVSDSPGRRTVKIFTRISMLFLLLASIIAIIYVVAGRTEESDDERKEKVPVRGVKEDPPGNTELHEGAGPSQPSRVNVDTTAPPPSLLTSASVLTSSPMTPASTAAKLKTTAASTTASVTKRTTSTTTIRPSSSRRPFPDSATTATEITVTQETTSTTTTTTTRRPMARRPLVCTQSAWHGTETRYPKEGVCDYILIPVDITDHGVTSVSGQSISREAISLARGGKTAIGHWFAPRNISGLARILALLKTRAGEGALAASWREGMRHYAVLNYVLSGETPSDDTANVIDFFKKLEFLHETFRTGQPGSESYRFLGITVVKGTRGHEKMREEFYKLMNEAPVDAVVWVTSYQSRKGKCYITGPSMWNSSVAHTWNQPTFVETFSFRRSVTVPFGMPELLTLTNHGLRYQGLEGKPFNATSWRFGQSCGSARRSRYEEYCSSSSGEVIGIRQQHGFRVSKDKDYLDIYEVSSTIEEKICKSVVEYHFKGGWLIYNLDYGDPMRKCPNPAYEAAYPLTNLVRERGWNRTFTSCNDSEQSSSSH